MFTSFHTFIIVIIIIICYYYVIFSWLVDCWSIVSKARRLWWACTLFFKECSIVYTTVWFLSWNCKLIHVSLFTHYLSLSPYLSPSSLTPSFPPLSPPLSLYITQRHNIFLKKSKTKDHDWLKRWEFLYAKLSQYRSSTVHSKFGNGHWFSNCNNNWNGRQM